jgi:PilZ domain
MSETLIERRASVRHRVFKGGKLAFNSGGGVECTVRNISPGGARVDLKSPVALPESFMLLIAADHFVRRCRSVWTRNTQIGVAFD